MAAIKAKLSQVIIESDSYVAIRAIIGDIKAPSNISNIIADIFVSFSYEIFV